LRTTDARVADLERRLLFLEERYGELLMETRRAHARADGLELRALVARIHAALDRGLEPGATEDEWRLLGSSSDDEGVRGLLHRLDAHTARRTTCPTPGCGRPRSGPASLCAGCIRMMRAP
jgi:hypothetical protein